MLPEELEQVFGSVAQLYSRNLSDAFRRLQPQVSQTSRASIGRDSYTWISSNQQYARPHSETLSVYRRASMLPASTVLAISAHARLAHVFHGMHSMLA